MNVLTIDQAAAILPAANRVLVFGCSGSGKSTLSRKLCALFDLPYLSMDRDFFWLPGWKMRERGEIRRRIGEAVERDRWLMDGTSPGTMDLRLPRTDLAIWFRPPRWRSLWGVYSRVWKSYGIVRPEMAEGCPEHWPEWNFLTYIWNFERKDVPEIEEKFAAFGPDVPVLMLKSHKDSDRLLEISSRPR
jgi:adenylate kinase family enzyme